MGYYKNKAIDAEWQHALDLWGPSMNQMKLFQEKDPYGKDLKAGGAKADAGKSPVVRGVLQYFPRAILEVGRVSSKGAEKYSWQGWRTVPEGEIRYADALGRHIVSEGIEGEFDSETGLLHAAQQAWNALARLELILERKEKENNGQSKQS